MNTDEALALVRRILSDKLGLDADEIVPSDHLRDDLGLDSLDAIDLVESVQEEFGDVVEPSAMGTVGTVGELVELICRPPATAPAP